MFSTRITGVTSSHTDTGTVVSTHGRTKPKEFGVVYTNPVISQAALIEVSFLPNWKIAHKGTYPPIFPKRFFLLSCCFEAHNLKKE